MFKQISASKRIVVQGKKGSYTLPTKLLKQIPVKQEKLYEEFWQ